jgi:hypothetical protein
VVGENPALGSGVGPGAQRLGVSLGAPVVIETGEARAGRVAGRDPYRGTAEGIGAPRVSDSLDLAGSSRRAGVRAEEARPAFSMPLGRLWGSLRLPLVGARP